MTWRKSAGTAEIIALADEFLTRKMASMAADTEMSDDTREKMNVAFNDIFALVGAAKSMKSEEVARPITAILSVLIVDPNSFTKVLDLINKMTAKIAIEGIVGSFDSK